MQCPICGLQAESGAGLCACGYDVASGETDAAVRAAIALRDQARSLRTLAAVALGLIPASVVAFEVASSYVVMMIVGVLVAFFGVIGASTMRRSLNMSSEARRRLRAVRAIRELPAARVVT